MVAGCSMAVMAMKIFMAPLVELLESSSPLVRPASLVDDVQWNLVGRPSEVAELTVQTIHEAKRWILERGLVLSSGKNVLVASSIKVERAVLAEVSAEFQGATVSRYVGTGLVASRRRRTQLQRVRWKKCGGRLSRLRQAKRMGANIRLATRMSALSAGCWGLSARGVAPTVLGRMRSQTA
eukprot:6006303-Amphidinium_carterae.1